MESSSGVRRAARVLVINEDSRLLLLRAVRPDDGYVFWLAPGGGVDESETFEAAAVRELREETGLVVELGPCVWTRRHILLWNGRQCDQYEQFFVARTQIVDIQPCLPDIDVTGHRWWSLAELAEAVDDFAPRRLATLLPPLLKGEYPKVPMDCGV